ncbi:response regulator [Vagococcus fluvialis]|uniref:response regulator n=1 Tax=Vagococcus fluvialis TaxID=2738 RepID=UPI001A8EC088|nr:response regulator [Vagococcus fluvialis]MBO0478574.1 response regulator [Vagococcus fluvialis]MBO0485652.1 response regulator [Vagococcus fluvialis]
MTILIIEDDPMVASINQQFIEKIKLNTTIKNVRNTEEGLKIIQSENIELILLDVYLPGMSGTDLLKELNKIGIQIPVILITAADDSATLNDALSYQVIDYLIKPFTFERLKLAINKYDTLHDIIDHNKKTDQSALDYVFNGITNTSDTTLFEKELPKGLSRLTLKKIMSEIEKFKQPFSTETLAKQVTLSRISTKKYITFLLELFILDEQMEYQEIGRPITLYSLKPDFKEKLFDYL